MTNISQRLVATVEAVLKSPAVEVSSSHLEPYDGGAVGIGRLWESLLRRSGKLPPIFRDMIAIGDRLGIFWQSRQKLDSEIVYGEFSLKSPLIFTAKNPLPEVFQDQKHKGIDMRNVRMFDFYARNGGPIHALLRVDGKNIEDRIYIFDEEEVFRSELDCADYLEELCRTRGMLYWQYLFCKDKKLHSFDVDPIDRGLRFLEEEFSEDCTALRERLKRARRA